MKENIIKIIVKIYSVILTINLERFRRKKKRIRIIRQKYLKTFQMQFWEERKFNNNLPREH